MAKAKSVLLVLGDQLFPIELIDKINVSDVFMAEDLELCTHFRYHQQKIVLFLSSMRQYAQELETHKYKVHYEQLSEKSDLPPFEQRLVSFLTKSGCVQLHVFEIEDRFFEERLINAVKKAGITLTVHQSPMFLTSRAEFQKYLKEQKRPFMKTFYQSQRRRLKIMVDKDGQPEGGRWSFDDENRKKLPKDIDPPVLPVFKRSKVVTEVIALVEQRFSDHPGEAQNFWLPSSRKEALSWLDDFLKRRFAAFGDFEDAISRSHRVMFHSVLTPVLNTGLITPEEVVSRALQATAKRNSGVPINALEGFIRQIIGWREFIRGIYRGFGEVQLEKNFWEHDRKLGPVWYSGTTGIDPLDHSIKAAVSYGYCHHIERLMVVGNIMLLCKIHPLEVYKWFMEMFVDSADWVMGPNVFGMSQYSDGGIFATKPYICASNYLLKMSDFKKGAWCQDVDALFWSFLHTHRTFFQKNPRLNMLCKTLEKRGDAYIADTHRHADQVRSRLSFV
jgi:deoxyribodipyrimidine photolyase-related protein